MNIERESENKPYPDCINKLTPELVKALRDHWAYFGTRKEDDEVMSIHGIAVASIGLADYWTRMSAVESAARKVVEASHWASSMHKDAAMEELRKALASPGGPTRE